MISSTYSRQMLLAILLLASSFAMAQTNNEKIKAKWSVDKLETEKNTPQAIKAKQDLQNVFLTFDNQEVVISKKTQNGDSLIKKGPYSVSGNTLIIGKDAAVILLLSEKQLTIKLPGQGVLYLTKI